MNSYISGLRCAGVNNGCCTSIQPCKVDDGDCDDDTHCEGSLKCGVANCNRTKYPSFEANDDCCYNPKGEFLILVYLLKYSEIISNFLLQYIYIQGDPRKTIQIK